MNNYTLTIFTEEKKGVLDDITSVIAAEDVNISYTHLFIDVNGNGTINLDLNNVIDIDVLVDKIKSIKEVRSIEIHDSLNQIYGKRILIFGGGAQVSQVAMGAISEADRHNIRGERISVDTLPLVGEDEIANAVDAINRISRVKVLVLAGSIMGGNITKAIRKVKKDNNLIVISLNMVGSVTDVADLIVTDPTQAGVMAVMAIADTAVFDIKNLKENKF